MRTSEVLKAWSRILKGEQPALSIEITKECPLRCPGCYAYGEDHLNGEVTLRGLSDFKGDALIRGVLDLVDQYKPLHLSLVGGDPLVRYRELEEMVPQILARGVHIQIVTSAFRPIAKAWAGLKRLSIAVSIDGLQPEHDVRRAPATYERILKNIAGQNITIHCTITGQMMKRHDYLREFLTFWTPRPEIRRVWFSIFTPQKGESLPEVLTRPQRAAAIAEMLKLRREFPKLEMPEGLIRQFAHPPRDPADCVFAQTTTVLSADLTTKVTPCQFGGNPDCSQCGCMASMGLAAIASHKWGGFVPVGAIFDASLKIGRARTRQLEQPKPAVALRVLK